MQCCFDDGIGHIIFYRKMQCHGFEFVSKTGMFSPGFHGLYSHSESSHIWVITIQQEDNTKYVG